MVTQQHNGTKPRVRVAHSMQGRFRLKVSPSEHRNQTMARIQHRLDGTPGVKRTEANPSTRSVIVYHEE
ncbi:MAG: hypothetical protein ACR2PL_06190 [Dehalococcoidia bacterium]